MQFILLLIIALLLYNLQARLYSKYWSSNLSIRIAYDRSYAHIGDTLQLTEQIENRKLLPLPVIHVKFKTDRSFSYEAAENTTLSDYYYRNDAFSILGNQQVTRSLTFRTTHRGYFPITAIHVVVKDLFLQQTYAQIYDNHTALYVYPRLLGQRNELETTGTVLGEIKRQTLYEDPLSFRGIREYTTRDNLHSINWKASAHTGSLMVNTHFPTGNMQIVLLLNLDTNRIQRSQDLQEYILSVTATLIHHMTDCGYHIQLAVNLPDTLTNTAVLTESGYGFEHYHHLLQTLSRLDLSGEILSFREFFQPASGLFSSEQSNTMYWIISNYRKEDLLQAYQEKKDAGYSIAFLCPEYASYCQPLKGLYYWEVPANAA